MKQGELFGPTLPRGLLHCEEFITIEEESALLAEIRSAPLRQARYRQFTARRRTVNYGSAYDFTHRKSLAAPPIPQFLHSLRQRAADWVGVEADDFAQALVAEYQPGAPLGWHRDVPDFEIVAGISLGGVARIRFRPYPWTPQRRREVFSIELTPRSAYVLRDEARWAWQHQIPPVKALRYSITFRTRRAREASDVLASESSRTE